MALKVGIIGLTNTGKTTIFNCFSNTKAETSNYSFSTNKSNIGMAYVPDKRLEELSELVPTKKIVYTTMEFVDIPGLTKGASQGQGIGNSFLGDIRNVDALIHVTRCFEDKNLPHVEGSIDPVRDIEILDFELQIKDLESVEKRLAKLVKKAQSGDKSAKKEVEVLEKVKEHLENLQNVRSLELSTNEKQRLERLIKRDNGTDPSALAVIKAKIKAQISEEERLKRADYVIYNDDKDEVLPQIEKLHYLHILNHVHVRIYGLQRDTS
jgi:GTP-binding protein YchF